MPRSCRWRTSRRARSPLVCSALHGVELAPDGRPRRGCSAPRHDHEHADGTAHVSLTVDARTNSIVVAAPPGRDAELERALELVRRYDAPVAGAS